MSRPTLGVERGNTWSTQDEHDYLWAWVNTQPKATRHQLATTRENRPIRMYTYGDLSKPTLLLIGGQHGNEPSGREVLLWLAREMADTNMHQRATSYGSVAIIPDANPDGRSVSIRENSVGVDPNRDHILLSEAEAQAINSAIKQLDPVMIADLHEYGGEDADAWVQTYLREDTHPEIAEHGNAAYRQVINASQAAGYDTQPYPFRYRLTLNGVASLMHTVGVLIEVRYRGRTRPERFESQKPPLHALINYFANNVKSLHHAAAASRADAAQRPGPELLYLWNAQANPESGQYHNINEYELIGSIPQRLVDAHGINVSNGVVPLKQPARGIIPELIDPELDAPVAPATRNYAPQIPAGKLASAIININGQPHHITNIIHHDESGRKHTTI